MKGLCIPAEGTENEGMETGSTLPLYTTPTSVFMVILHSGDGTAKQGNVSQRLEKAGESNINLTVEVLVGKTLRSCLPTRSDRLRRSS